MSMDLSDEDLHALLQAGESDRVEFKRNISPDRMREAICAFANDLPNHQLAGVIFVGVDDDGRPTGLDISDKLMTDLANMKSDGKIVPPPSMTVSKLFVREAEIAAVIVQPADSPPARLDGRIVVRVGPRKGVASRQDERVLNEKRRHKDRPFDIRPLSGTRLEDLDLHYFESEYLPNAVAPDVLDANDRTLEERLASSKMIAVGEGQEATVLGMLAVGKSPQDYLSGAYIQFLRFDAGEDIIDEARIEGKIDDVLRRMEDKLAAHNRRSADFTSEMKEVSRYDYPPVALQQIVRNAVMHRTYEDTNAPVRVTWYDDRIEIWSPGGPYGLVDAQNFGKSGVTDYRNPNLAECLRVLGWVQKFGAGIARARSEMEKNGNPQPEFEIEPTHVGVILRARR